MSTLDMGVAAGAALAGLVAILWLRSLLKRRLGGKADGAARAPANGADAPLIERRVSAVERAQAEIVGRLDDMAETGAPEERMQAMASSLVGLIRDKNAAMETALAGLDQLRARLGTLEKIGDMAEARALFDGMAERLDALETGRKEAEAAFGARLAALSERLEGDGGPAAALAARLEKLHERKDAGLAATMARIEPLETRLGRIETAMKALPAEAAERVEGRIGEIARLQSDVQAELAALRARADSAPAPFAEISEQLTRLYAQKDSTTEAMLARLAPLEAKLAELETGLRAADPRAALDRFAERLAESETRLSGEIETLKSAENPFAEISDQLTRLYAQKDSTTEAMLARLAPLEAKLAELETGLRAADPRAALDRFAERLAASEAAHGADHARLSGEIETLKAAENPFAEISDQLTRLYAQKDSTTEAMLARLAPLEAKLAELETGLRAADPRAALDRFAERLAESETRLSGEIETLKAAENPFAEISDQLTRLYAQKDSTTEAMLARLAPLEAKLAELETGLRDADPRAALDRFAERLAESETRLSGEIETLKAAENPFAEISDQLTRLYAQKDSTTEAMLARLAPLEAKLAELETGLRAADPRAALDRFAERLAASEAAHGADHARLSGEIETLKAAENPFAEISDQLTRLYAQKDAVIEAMLARLAPVEAKLAEMEKAVAEKDPQAAIERFAERLAASEARLSGEIETLRSAENPFAEISDQLTRLYAQKDGTVAAMLARLAPLEAKLAGIETEMGARDPQAAIAGLAERIERLQDGQGDLAERLAAASAAAVEPYGALSERVAELAGSRRWRRTSPRRIRRPRSSASPRGWPPARRVSRARSRR